MLCLNYFEIPDSFSLLLRSNLNAKENAYNYIIGELSKNKGHALLVEKIFLDNSPKSGLFNSLKSLGWISFRNRIASAYVSKIENGIFSHVEGNLNILDILQFEEKFSKYTVEGYNRLFLLGLYMKLSCYSKYSSIDWSEYIFDSLLETLDQAKSKTIKIDWLILMLIHLHQVSKTKILSQVKSDLNWHEIFSFLDEDIQQSFINNFLTYGASITENDIFYGVLTE